MARLVALATCTLVLAPGARLISTQFNVWFPDAPVMEHDPGPAYAGLMLQATPGPAGRESLMVTLVAVPVPMAALLLAVMVNPMAEPALTADASAVMVMPSDGACTSAPALALMEGALLADAVAVLEYLPVPARLVGLLRCTLVVAPDARFPRAQFRVWLPAAPVIEHVPGPLYAGLMLQITPEPAGRESLMLTSVAVAVPVATLLTVIVKPIGTPALTADASAVFAILSAGA